METVEQLFGHSKNLTPLQMSLRAVLVAGICLLLVRFSGRRLFGMGMALDNAMAFLLAGVLSRAVVGASPFLSTIAAAATIAVLHRLFATIGLYNQFINRLVKGEEKIVYDRGRFIPENMKRCRITEQEIMEGVRLNAHIDTLDNVKSVYVECNGKISVVLKNLEKINKDESSTTKILR